MTYFLAVLCFAVVTYVADLLFGYYLLRLPVKGNMTRSDKETIIYSAIDNVAYRIACWFSFGLVYIIRVIITEGISVALLERGVGKRHKHFIKNIFPEMFEEEKNITPNKDAGLVEK